MAPSPSLTTRVATPGDLPVLEALERAAFGDEAWSPVSLRDLVEDEAPSFLVRVAVATDDPHPAVPIAYAAFQRVLDEAELLRVATDPARRRHGVARQLLEAVLSRLEADGLALCRLEVRADNAAAIGLYQGLGFVASGSRRAYYRDGTDALLMERRSPRPRDGSVGAG